jgi:glutaredoxin
MEKGELWILGSIFVVLALIILYAGITGLLVKDNGDYPDTPSQYDDFAKALTNAGVKMYGADWCPHCQEQKKLFGNSFRFIEYVNCETQERQCQINDISSIPVWEVNGQKHLGVLTLQQLSELSSIPLN